MFQLRYVASELRRRAGRTVLTALGLAAGVGLVIGIIGVSQGLDDAQTKVLSPLSKIGTDVLVTRVAGATTNADGTPASTTSTTAAQQGNGFRQGGGANSLAACTGGGGGGFFGGGGGPGGANASTLNQADCTALLNDNDSVLTDLSKLGPAGTKYQHDFFLPATLLTFPDAALATVSKLDGVASATPGLTLIAEHVSGTVPQQVVNVTTNQQQITQTVRPAPMTDAERAAFQTCLESKGVTFGGGGGGGNSTTPTTARGTTPTTAAAGANGGPDDNGGGGGAGGGFRRFDNSAFQDCQPARFKEFQNTVVVPARQISQIVNPPQTDTTNTNYTVAGIDPNSPNSGLVTVDQVKKGAFLKPGANTTVLLSVAYANKKSLDVGSTLTVNGANYTVAGLVDPALTGSTADVYFTLPKLQELSSKTGRVNQVLVKAKSSGDVDKVAAEIAKAIPGAQVVTTKALSNQVTGSLADAKKLANRLGGALAVIVLAAVFAIAMLLTLSSVAKRIREIGTLRAIGWSKGMVVRQVVSETVGIGILGGVLGIVAGYGVAGLVHVFSPSLEATSAGVPSFGSSSLSNLFGAAANQSKAVSTTVHLTAPVHLSTLAIGVGFAILGGLLAGAVGGWRAARLSPAEALRNVG